jgi:hypothetical protein
MHIDHDCSLWSIIFCASASVFGVGFSRVRGLRRHLQQFRALLIKHIIHSRRNVILTLVQVALPVFFAIIACILELVIKGPTDPPPLWLNMSGFDNPIITSSSGLALSPEAESLAGFYQAEARRWSRVETIDSNMDDYLLNVAKNLDRYNRYYLVAGKPCCFARFYCVH